MTLIAEPQVNAYSEADIRKLPSDVSKYSSPAWWGMVFFIVTEATLFAMLFVSYFYLRVRADSWPMGEIEDPKLRIPIMMTFLLVGSSIPMYLAERSIKRDNIAGLKAGLVISAVMGLMFMGLFAKEYHDDLREFWPTMNAYGSIFFLITGLHGIHVVIGLIMNGFTQLRAWLGHFDGGHHIGVSAPALYWHFVDAVWVFVFTIVYLSPHMS